MPQKRWLVWNEKHCEILNRLIGSRFGLIAYAMMSPYDQSWQYLTTNINPWIIDHQTRIWWNAMRNTNLYTAIISHSFSWDVSIYHLWFCCLCYYNMVQGSSAGKTINPSLPGKTVFGVLMWYDHYNLHPSDYIRLWLQFAQKVHQPHFWDSINHPAEGH